VFTKILIGYGKSTTAQKNIGIDRTAYCFHQLLETDTFDIGHLVDISIGAAVTKIFQWKSKQRLCGMRANQPANLSSLKMLAIW
jgi:hypothetical protein